MLNFSSRLLYSAIVILLSLTSGTTQAETFLSDLINLDAKSPAQSLVDLAKGVEPLLIEIGDQDVSLSNETWLNINTQSGLAKVYWSGRSSHLFSRISFCSNKVCSEDQYVFDRVDDVGAKENGYFHYRFRFSIHSAHIAITNEIVLNVLVQNAKALSEISIESIQAKSSHFFTVEKP